MIRHSRIRPILVALLLCSAAGAHAQATGADTVYRLHGRVINALTGKPLARALVTSGDRRLATMTGNEGQFAFNVSVPSPQQNSSGMLTPGSFNQRFSSGLVTLNAEKPGYIPIVRMPFLPLDDTLSTTSVEIKLMPAAVITGRVSSAAIDSAANVRVMLLQHQVNNGERMWMPSNAQMTNSHGEFRFTNLRPGEYTLVTAEWQGDKLGTRSGTEISEQYPPVYYGDAHTLATATKFNLHYGDTLSTEFHLHLAPYFPVVIPVTGNMGPVSVRLDTFDNFQLGYNARDAAVEGSLPAGDYNLALSSRGPNQQQSFALLPLHVAGAPVRTAAVALATPSPVEVHVHTQFSKPEDSTNLSMAVRASRKLGASGPGQLIETTVQPVQVSLRSEDNQGGYSSTRQNATGDLVIENVRPGRYFVVIQPFRGYVASATRGGIDLLQHQMIVGPGGGGEPIEITLRDDTANVTGTVNYGGGPAQQSFILLLPTDDSGRFTLSYSGPDGKFTAIVAPGAYRVLAFRTNGPPPQIAWHDAETMHRYDHQGATITVTAGQTQTVDLRSLDEADRLEE